MDINWIRQLFLGQGVAHSVLLLGLVATLGIALGRLRLGKISLGGTMVLFVGILAGHLGMTIEHEVLHFVREFGLILFVYAVGLQVGPSFFSSFKKGGLRLNLLASLIVLLGVGLMISLHYLTGIPMPTMVGIMSGAVTNTPGLGAAQNAFADLPTASEALLESISLGYAVTYPLGVIGTILAILAIRFFFRIRQDEEEEKLRDSGTNEGGASMATFEITNPNIVGQTIDQCLGGYTQGNVVVSRHWDKETKKTTVATPKTILSLGDRVFAVASEEDLKTLQTLFGPRYEVDRKLWIPTDAHLVSENFVLTNKNLTGRKLSSLQLRQLYAVNVTRINRSGVDFVPSPNTRLQVGDRLRCVGSDVAISKVRALLGDSKKHLNEPNLIGIFLGIALGVFIGSIPLMIPGIPQPVKLGLAGGPLVVAILLSRFGEKFQLVTYTTQSANLMLRELGITLFLACVGINAGHGFISTILGGGYVWILYGFLITVLPLLLVGTLARRLWKVNYFTLAGAMAGSMTDPPALAYSNTMTEHEAPSVGYATVYPLTMFLRVLAAQLLILFFAS